MSNPAQVSSQSRFAYIDALRGWAMLLVLFGHCAGMAKIDGWLRTFADGCMMGVNLFFVISAYTIFYMFSKHSQVESQPVRNFMIRRFFRIAPLYWFAIGYYNVIWDWLPESKHWHYFLNFFFLHALNPETHTSVVPGGWTISIEMIFYLLVPLLFPFIRSFNRAWIFMLVAVFVFPLITFLISLGMNPLFADVLPYQVAVYWERFPLVTIGIFAFGIVLFYFIKEERKAALIRNKTFNVINLLIIGIALSALAFMTVHFPLKSHFYGALFMLLALMLSAHPWKVLVNPVTVFLGRISYSMYIFHFAVITWLYKWIPAQFPNLMEHGYPYFFVYFVFGLLFTVPLGLCGYHFIEKPAIRCSQMLVTYLENNPRKDRADLKAG